MAARACFRDNASTRIARLQAFQLRGHRGTAGAGRSCDTSLVQTEVVEGGLDLCGQQIEIQMLGLVGVEGVEAESLPPSVSRSVQRGDDDRAAGGFRGELDRSREHVGCECGSDPESCVPVVDGETAEQQCWDRIRSPFANRSGAVERSMPVIATLADATMIPLASAMTQVAAVSRRRFWPA